MAYINLQYQHACGWGRGHADGHSKKRPLGKGSLENSQGICVQYFSPDAVKNQVTNEGLKGIENVDWPCLEGLSLNDNRIDRAGV
jgi:hypothetical protein